MTKPQIADALAVRMILNGEQKGLQALNKQVSHLHGLECPECGSRNVEDNGMKRLDELTYLCTDCTHQWDAVPA